MRVALHAGLIQANAAITKLRTGTAMNVVGSTACASWNHTTSLGLLADRPCAANHILHNRVACWSPEASVTRM
jgi:hypothetical protein